MSSSPVIAKSTLNWKVSITGGLQQLVFNKPIVTVGRDPDCDVVLESDLKVSRKHFKFEMRGAQLWIKNISEKNSIFVNQMKIDELQITDTCSVQVGDTILKVEVEPAFGFQPKQPPPIHLKSLEPLYEEKTKVANQFGMDSSPQPLFIEPQKREKTSGNSQVSSSNQKTIIYFVLILIIGSYLFFDNKPSQKVSEGLKPRLQVEVSQSLVRSQDAVSKILEDKEKSGQNTLQYKTAQEHYLKGFRDYQNGQYGRAIQSFQAALSFYPKHDLALKYHTQAVAQQEKLIQFHLNQGLQNRGRNNFRLCKASYQKVMILVKDSTNPAYIQAKQFFDECSLRISDKGAL